MTRPLKAFSVGVRGALAGAAVALGGCDLAGFGFGGDHGPAIDQAPTAPAAAAPKRTAARAAAANYRCVVFGRALDVEAGRCAAAQGVLQPVGEDPIAWRAARWDEPPIMDFPAAPARDRALSPAPLGAPPRGPDVAGASPPPRRPNPVVASRAALAPPPTAAPPPRYHPTTLGATPSSARMPRIVFDPCSFAILADPSCAR